MILLSVDPTCLGINSSLQVESKNRWRKIILYGEKLTGDERMSRNADYATFVVIGLTIALLVAGAIATGIGYLVIFVRHV